MDKARGFRKLLLLLMLLISVLLVTGCNTIQTHVPLKLKSPCVFDKFTQEEKQSMTKAVGQKIYSNQEGCKVRHMQNLYLIDRHNELHK